MFQPLRGHSPVPSLHTRLNEFKAVIISADPTQLDSTQLASSLSVTTAYPALFSLNWPVELNWVGPGDVITD